MKDISEYFKEENIDNSYIQQPSVTYSPDNAHRVEVFSYKIGNPEDHFWNYTRGLVYDNETNELLFDIGRNYPSFYRGFLHHNNGNVYMICGRNYHGGYTILDLTNKLEYNYEPESADKYAAFFCWIEAKYDSRKNTLDVIGCYWGAPYEIVTYDFSDPTSLPLREISRCYLNEEEE